MDRERTGELRIRHDGADVDAGQVVRHQVGHLREPEIGQGRQDFALARHRVGKNDVVGGQAVGRDDQQVVVVDAIDVANLATADQRQFGNGGFENRVFVVHGDRLGHSNAADNGRSNGSLQVVGMGIENGYG